uniref:Uncharacterized protein n=1 Tax=Arundo donax TaxID=35708 RepID=A0A0A9ENS8_ARUDO
MRALDSSHIFLINSPLRPMIDPTFWDGTSIRKTLSPGQQGHLLSSTLTCDLSCCLMSPLYALSSSSWKGFSGCLLY